MNRRPPPISMPACGKIASDVFESLFGDLRRGADIDHERHPMLFADLCDGHRATGIDVSDDAVGAFVDDALEQRSWPRRRCFRCRYA